MENIGGLQARAGVEPGILSLDAVADKTLLIVDDDRAFCQRLARAMESRGFTVNAVSWMSFRS